MGKTAVIFPGQGAQYVGMAKDFYDNFEDSKKVFDEADEVLDIELKKTCFEENDDINKTEYTQPAMVAAEVAIYEHLKNAGLKADVFAAIMVGMIGMFLLIWVTVMRWLVICCQVFLLQVFLKDCVALLFLLGIIALKNCLIL